MKLKLLVFISLVFATLTAGSAQARPLDLFKWERRVALLFADQPSDPWAFKMRLELLEDRCQFDARDLILIEVFSDTSVKATGKWINGEVVDEYPLTQVSNLDLRRYYQFNRGFGFVLVGKDGWEKRRSRLPDDVPQVFRQIDGMPMRQQEKSNDAC